MPKNPAVSKSAYITGKFARTMARCATRAFLSPQVIGYKVGDVSRRAVVQLRRLR